MTPLKKTLKLNRNITLVAVGIVVVFIILQCIFGGYFIVGSLVGLLMVLGGIHDRKRIRRSFCPHCEEQYDYENDVAWESSNVVTTASKQKADVEVECTCHCCGRKTQFVKRFETAEVDTLGRVKQYNIYNLVRKYFIK